MENFTLQLYAPEYGSYRPKLQVHRDDYDSYDPCDGHKDYDACSEKALADDDLDSVYGTDFLQSPTHNRRALSSSYGNFTGGGGIPMPCCDQCQYYCHVHGTQAATSCPSTSSATAKRHSYTFGGHNQTMRQRPNPPPPSQQQQPGFRHNSQRATYLSESYQLHERLRQLSEPRRRGSDTSKKSPGRSRRSSYADGSLEPPPSDAGAYGGSGGAEEARPSRMPPIASLGTLREHPERQRLHKMAPAPGDDDDMHRRERWARRRLFGRRSRPAAASETDDDEYRESWVSRLLSKASQRRGGYRKTLWLNPYGF